MCQKQNKDQDKRNLIVAKSINIKNLLLKLQKYNEVDASN